jgi:L,D-transpeptidase ErfK/SrfK
MCARFPAFCSLIAAIAASAGIALAADSPVGPMSGSVTTYVVQPGDTLTIVAARFGVYPTTIASDNGIDARQTLQAGRSLRIDNRHLIPDAAVPGEIVVNVPQRMVFLRSEGQVVAYPVAVGRSTWQTPFGMFTVNRKDEDPAWHPPASIRAESARAGHTLPRVVPPGPNNPLGRFWIGLSLQSIGIHGTPIQSSIYQSATHGCIRLQRESIEDLYARVSLGTRGQIIYEPVLLASIGDEVYIEVHPDIYGKLPRSFRDEVRRLAVRAGVDQVVDWVLVDREIERHAGIARRVSRGE